MPNDPRFEPLKCHEVVCMKIKFRCLGFGLLVVQRQSTQRRPSWALGKHNGPLLLLKLQTNKRENALPMSQTTITIISCSPEEKRSMVRRRSIQQSDIVV